MGTPMQPGRYACDACEREFDWNDASSWWGKEECAACGWAAVLWMACSDACAAALKGATPKGLQP